MLGGKAFLFTYILIAVVLFGVGAFLLGYYFEIDRSKKRYDFDNPVIAICIDVDRTGANQQTAAFRYDLIYEYIAPDGTYYTGYKSGLDWFSSESAARKAYIGKEVEIYIDGKGGSTPNDYSGDNEILMLVLSIIFLSIGVAFVVIFMIPHRWKPPKPPECKFLLN